LQLRFIIKAGTSAKCENQRQLFLAESAVLPGALSGPAFHTNLWGGLSLQYQAEVLGKPAPGE